MRLADRHRLQGLTLVEVLATTVLVGLVASIVLRTWSAPSDKARLRALVQEVIALDARTRLAARTGTPALLSLDPKNRRLLARARGLGAAIAEVAFAPTDTIAMRRDTAIPTTSVAFLADGTSSDYAVEVQHAGLNARVDIAGLTGWATVAEGLQ